VCRGRMTFTRIPQACFAIDKATLDRLVPGGEGLEGTPLSRGGILHHHCGWNSAGPYGLRRLTLVLELVSAQAGVGQGAIATAMDRFRAMVNDQSEYGGGGIGPLGGLGDEALLSTAAAPAFRQASVHARSQNLIVVVAFAGSNDDHSLLSAEVTANGAITAARAVLAALATS
jgi:hypothetical protein